MGNCAAWCCGSRDKNGDDHDDSGSGSDADDKKKEDPIDTIKDPIDTIKDPIEAYEQAPEHVTLDDEIAQVPQRKIKMWQSVKDTKLSEEDIKARLRTLKIKRKSNVTDYHNVKIKGKMWDEPGKYGSARPFDGDDHYVEPPFDERPSVGGGRKGGAGHFDGNVRYVYET